MAHVLDHAIYYHGTTFCDLPRTNYYHIFLLEKRLGMTHFVKTPLVTACLVTRL